MTSFCDVPNSPLSEDIDGEQSGGDKYGNFS